jgi:hypothetical protein
MLVLPRKLVRSGFHETFFNLSWAQDVSVVEDKKSRRWDAGGQVWGVTRA